MINLPITGLSNDKTNISCISNDKESDPTNYLHEDENNRKSYPQRNNRSKLNYRDLERGMYEEIRQSMRSMGGPTFMNRNNGRFHNNVEHEIIDLSIDDDDDDDGKSTNETEQTYRRLWCICHKPWDASRLMLRCNSCANWFHGDCIGINAKEGKAVEIDRDQFVCPACRGVPVNSPIARTKTSEESIPIKRKRSDENSSIEQNGIRQKTISHDESSKKPKSNVLLQRDPPRESQILCIAHDCTNQAKLDWIYCSPACIRRHINETLQSIQRSKGTDDVDVPTSDDIFLYESKSKKMLEKTLVPKIEDLSTWINHHPSYQIMKSSSSQQSKDLTRTFPLSKKSKHSSPSITGAQKSNAKQIPDKESLIPLGKRTNKLTSNANSTADIRSKVPSALYDKIVMRLEKSGEQFLRKQEIQTRVNQIEEEMFRVYGKVDNSYKNKFRSLLANISNMKNNFFYKQIFSKDLTTQQIVAMKSEDMLPPEEKEKRKDQFEKEIQMIINSEEQIAKEIARRKRIKMTKQGLMDNDAHYSTLHNIKERSLSGEENKQLKDNQRIKSTTDESIKPTENLPLSSTKKINCIEEITPTISSVDLDNDYIEPESPTGIDAMIYDEENNEDNRNSTTHSPAENTEDILPHPQIIRDDYNPSKAKTETTSISRSTPAVRLPNQWRGIIRPTDTEFPCQSVHIYGECDHLVDHIPEQLVILGRLRLGDLWDYIRNSLAVRDVIILTLSSSSLTIDENELFVQYVETMHRSGRPAVICKCPNSSVIRDMYILAADTKECPPSVLSALFLPMIFESKQLFLVIIGAGKKTIKSIHQSNNYIYKPLVSQDSIATRDPRLLKNKSHVVQSRTMEYSNEELLKLISDSLQRIRDSSIADTVRSIVLSTTEILKSRKRDDLIARFNENLRVVVIEWQTVHGNTLSSILPMVIGDNLVEENMDVDDDQEKQIITSSSSRSIRELKDVKYRFRNQDMDHPTAKTNEVNHHRKQRRKSRFSDVLPADLERTKKLKSKDDKSTMRNTALRTNNIKLALPDLSDKHINSSFSTKFQPMIHSFVPAIDTKKNLTSNSLPFVFSKSSTNSNDVYERSSKLLPDSIERTRTCGNWTRSTAKLNHIVQQETKSRFSSNTNDWRSRSSNNYYMAHYHDFDQPQE